jgi:small-conductance mechanosensitive channel
MKETWDNIYFNNTVEAWVTSAAIFIGCLILIWVFKHVVLYWLKKWAAKTATTIDDFIVEMIEKSIVPLLYAGSLYLAVNTLTLKPMVSNVFHVAFLFVATFFVLGIITSFIRQFIFSFIKSQDNSEVKEKQAKGFLIIVNVVIWILGIIFIINNLGYNVTTLVTGLGIGGIAIALAAQTILADLFSYFVIFFDRPFEIGDFIIIGDKMGTVDYVGIKTTRLKTLNGEQLICSNTYLTNAQVHNFKRMQERRIVFKLGVTYQTPHEKLNQIPGMVKLIVEERERVRFDRAHFSSFGASSLDFEFVYYILSPDYNIYMDKQQEIYLAIYAAFEAANIEFAYPTQTLYLNNETSDVAKEEDAAKNRKFANVAH